MMYLDWDGSNSRPFLKWTVRGMANFLQYPSTTISVRRLAPDNYFSSSEWVLEWEMCKGDLDWKQRCFTANLLHEQEICADYCNSWGFWSCYKALIKQHLLIHSEISYFVTSGVECFSSMYGTLDSDTIPSPIRGSCSDSFNFLSY